MRMAVGIVASFAVIGGCSRGPASLPDARASVAPAETAASASASSKPPSVPPRTAGECRACRGDWGVHGIGDTESCNCRTSDGGKHCRDGAECQGVCIAAENPESDVVEKGPPARGFFVGRCSDLVTVFGCNRIIDRGTLSRGPVSLDDPPQTICVD